MCIPFFVLAGDLMNKGGVTKRLLNFARELVGWIPRRYGLLLRDPGNGALRYPGLRQRSGGYPLRHPHRRDGQDGYDADFTGSIICCIQRAGAHHSPASLSSSMAC